MNPAVAERLIRVASELAKHWDAKVPPYLYPLLDGHNSLLGDALGWLGHCCTRFNKSVPLLTACIVS